MLSRRAPKILLGSSLVAKSVGVLFDAVGGVECLEGSAKAIA